jgi:hypothetical protein
MSLWIKKLSVFVPAGALYLVGQYLWGRWFEDFPINLCQYITDAQGTYCYSPYVNTGFALIAAGEILAIVGVILLFANAAGLRRWLWLSLFYVPLAVIIAIWFVPTAPSLGFMNGGGASGGDRVNTVWNLGYLYILITFIIVLLARLRTPHPLQSQT